MPHPPSATQTGTHNGHQHCIVAVAHTALILLQSLRLAAHHTYQSTPVCNVTSMKDEPPGNIGYSDSGLGF